MKNSFFGRIKTSLDNYEEQYNPAHWNDLQKRLEKLQPSKPSSNIGKKIILSAAAVVAVVAVVYYFFNNNSENKRQEKVLVQQTAVVKENPKVAEQSNNPTIEQTNAEQPKPKNQESKTAEQPNNKIIEQSKVESQIKNQEASKNINPPIETKTSETVQPETSALTAAFKCNKNMICAGEPIELTSDNKISSCNYRWEFGDGQTSHEQNPKHIYKKEGTYSVKLKVESPKDKKSDEQIAKNLVTVRPVPNVDLKYSSADENFSAVNFEASGKDIFQWRWDFGDKQISEEQNPSHIYNKKGSYEAVVTATNNFACAATARRIVSIEHDYNLLAPNSFSPNGDGLNDTWIPVALQNGESVFTLTIFDKSNNLVYTTSNKNAPWDGVNAKAGDMFFWKAEVKEKNGKASSYNGFIVIK